MKPERTSEGFGVLLKPRGIGRFFSAAFLLVWLCVWLMGEAFVLLILVIGARALLTGQPPSPEAEPLELAPALMTGLFLLVWLSIWTLGGWMAGRELLRLIWSSDRIVARPDALVVHRRLGPFRSIVSIPRPSLRGLHAIPAKGRLIAETQDGTVELTSIAPRDAAASLAAAFREEMRLSREELAAATLPREWRELIDAEGGAILVHQLDERRIQARVAWGITALFAAVLIPAALSSGDRPDRLPMLVILATATAALAWGSWRLTATRLEWRIDSGRVRLRRRSARGVKDLFEGVALELVETSDSDGDAWFTLHAVAPGAPPSPRLATTVVKGRRRIAHEMDDPTLPRRLGAWLSQRASIPLSDRATAAHRKQELAEMVARLEAGGRLSRWLARWIQSKGPPSF